MYKTYEQRIAKLQNGNFTNLLCEGLIGLEKETLRVGEDGKIAQTPHPKQLGAALTHPYITTDYSEALTEIITPPFSDPVLALDFLKQTQAFVYQCLDNEVLWATSMPCVVAGDTSIPIARYGTSNPGMMKTVYRRGLGHRYGRTMQVIAGVHFNYSFAESFWPVYQEMERDQSDLQVFISEKYFDLLRNLQRFGWMVPYLFGASPAICKSFLAGQQTELSEFNEFTFYEPHATSLRMGDIGYQNNKEKAIGVKANYDSLNEYIASLEKAISTPYSGYEKFGIVENGEYQQLNSNILQIENEYYSTVRPKQVLEGNEKPVIALRKRGVKYVELRSIDVNAFDPLGINESQVRFLESFMLFCLLHDSPPFTADEQVSIDKNELIAAHTGRHPDCKLIDGNRSRPLREWAGEILGQMQAVCEILDDGKNTQAYSDALNRQKAKLEDPELTPSARMLQEMREQNEGFFHFALRKSKQHQDYFLGLNIPGDRLDWYQDLAEKSHENQQLIESAEQSSFADYLSEYFSQS